MLRDNITIKVILLGLIFCLISFAQEIQINNQPRIDTTINEYLQGKIDGEKIAKGCPAWICVGAGCGLLGILGAAVTPLPAPEKLLFNKSIPYSIGFKESWDKKLKSDNLQFAIMGLGIQVGILILWLNIK